MTASSGLAGIVQPLIRGAGLLGFILCLLASATAGAQPAFTEIADRTQALERLVHADPAQRAAAVQYIGRTGLATDGALLVERLADESPLVRELAERATWAVWSRSGDASADRLLAEGTAQMSAGRHREAIDLFTRVIRRKPDFAEGWNKRATARFLAGDLKRSQADCDEVLKRNPQHFGALSGYGQILLQSGDEERALEYFRRALAVNPNLEGVEHNIRGLEQRLREKRARTT
ncbi:MAG: tetratricopeptide repeat protein [Betaproteobacteria bacterium]|nr:tetratricopeptide repeat protein [Betaproteobacteria bacterium]